MWAALAQMISPATSLPLSKSLHTIREQSAAIILPFPINESPTFSHAAPLLMVIFSTSTATNFFELPLKRNGPRESWPNALTARRWLQ